MASIVRSLARAALPVTAAVLLARAPAARACSVCGCGDPLLDAADPAAMTSRLRVALDGESLDVTSGSETTPGATDTLHQYTLKLQAAANPVPGVTLVGTVPLTRKTMTTEGLTTSDVTGLGDVELAARIALLDVPNFAARRLQGVALSIGTSLPTGPNDLRAGGERIDEHGQPGTGSFGPFAGLHYRVDQGDWYGSASVTGRVHTVNGHGYRYGGAVLWSAHGQYRPVKRLALDLGVDGRWAAQDRDEAGPVLNTGGTVLSASPGLYWNAAGGAWLSVRAQLPVWTRLVGEQSVGPTVVAGVQYQLF
ncbi:hypothetical protein [Anaeromyxobacter oryzae]|uniref:Transporter n=1 Tax=Anaeromyxobacter oryzae TaxID=2918170 RepID=A0ABN6MVK0_9BACT|nr:hypothetical protein [Anaeromyxobacter oryzae]BDG04961.1 hypothetical protein AMOR_39570 [Anaeromyxobacter oryzae]